MLRSFSLVLVFVGALGCLIEFVKTDIEKESYEAIFTERSKLGQEQIERVHKSLSGLVQGKTKTNLYNNIILAEDGAVSKPELEKVIEAIKKLALGEKQSQLRARFTMGHWTGKTIVNDRKIREIIQVYLMVPCNSYLHQFGPQIFVPARVDTSFVESQLKAIEQEASEFDGGWAYYRICENLLHNREKGYGATLPRDIAKYVRDLALKYID